MSLLQEAMMAFISGLTTKKGNEIKWQNATGLDITIEPINIEQEEYIIRRYYDNGNKHFETAYRGDKKHGKSLCWDEKGQKVFEMSHIDDKKHGTLERWDNKGIRIERREYNNGLMNGEHITWDIRGKIKDIKKYKNGKIDENYVWYEENPNFCKIGEKIYKKK